MCLIRMTFAPFGVTSYIAGVTSMPVVSYCIGNTGYLVNILMQVFIGVSLYGMQGQDKSESKSMENTILAIEIGISILITLLLGWFAKGMIEERLNAYD